MPETELDQLAYRAYCADRQAQGDPIVPTWEHLDEGFQKRYRAIAHAIRAVFTDGFLTAPEYECQLLASLDRIGVEITHDERATGMAKYVWSIEKLDLTSYAESIHTVLMQILGELMAGYTPF